MESEAQAEPKSSREMAKSPPVPKLKAALKYSPRTVLTSLGAVLVKKPGQNSVDSVCGVLDFAFGLLEFPGWKPWHH